MVFVLLVLFLSVALNIVFLLNSTGIISNPFSEETESVNEKFYLGNRKATDKIAIVRVNGVISESSIVYPVNQLRAAAADKHVKAVIIRIDSPGGSVFASDELYKCIVNLRDNDGRRFPGTGPKPVSVSMGSLAASGGYYIAVAGNPIVAERTTLTGSIGVFAAIPNVAEWAHKHGVKLELIKDGSLKASGSFFHELSPEERQTWQDMVDGAYGTFLDVISKGRPGLTPGVLRTEVVIDRMVAKRDDKGNPIVKDGKPVEVKYTRVRADGGSFTAAQAQQFKLIDGIEDLPAAIRGTATRSGLSDYKAIVYEKERSVWETLTGLQIKNRATILEVPDFSANLIPRLWYLAPTADAGLLAPP